MCTFERKTLKDIHRSLKKEELKKDLHEHKITTGTYGQALLPD